MLSQVLKPTAVVLLYYCIVLLLLYHDIVWPFCAKLKFEIDIEINEFLEIQGALFSLKIIFSQLVWISIHFGPSDSDLAKFWPDRPVTQLKMRARKIRGSFLTPSRRNESINFSGADFCTINDWLIDWSMSVHWMTDWPIDR